MLKIKDDIDLKELEKYGFIDAENLCSMNKFYCTDNPITKIEIGKNDRNIWVTHFADKELDVLYDLIKDGLVEKVEE